MALALTSTTVSLPPSIDWSVSLVSKALADHLSTFIHQPHASIPHACVPYLPQCTPTGAGISSHLTNSVTRNILLLIIRLLNPYS